MQKKRKPLHYLYQFMKLSALQLIIAIITLTAVQAKETKAQEILNRQVSIELNDVKLKTALKFIEKTADVYFTYSPQKIDSKQKVSLTVQNATLESALNQLLLPLQIRYKVYNNSNVALVKDASIGLFLSDTVEEQVAAITGTVTGPDGEALIGATVQIKGTSVGTVTDADGKYSINAPDEATTLVFSYTGYETTEVAIDGRTVIDVSLSSGVNLEGITVLGSRGKPRTNVDRPVPIDVITTKELVATGQQDIGQSLHYTTPSFNAVKFGINDLAPLIDPASLRGLAPDQTLLLVNGKRRHKVSFFSLNHGVGKGQLGNDINAIPSAAIKRVEILRDGAAAQYGSDAIAGVMNMQLNDGNSGGAIRTYAGVGYSTPKYDGLGSNADQEGDNIYGDDAVTDGATFATSVNFGLPWGDDGFLNATTWFHHNEAYDRSGFYTHGAGWYPDNPDLSDAENEAADARLREINGIDLDRAVLGAAENTNGGVFMNAGKALSDNWDYYMFGGLSQKEIIGGIFSRAAARTDRSALDLFPNGFNPETPSVLTDWQILSGAKGDLGSDWLLDFSMGYSGNNLDLYNRNTVNPSLGSASPTQFYTGSLKVTQTLFNADLSRTFGNTSLAVGLESRFESFQQSQGQVESWVAGPLATAGKDVGSTGREGYSDRTDGEWNRNNTGIYAEVESDITESFLLGGAIRYENYSDFGGDFSYKVATRYKISDAFGIRGSVNRSFRAPSLAQLHYSNFAQIAFDDDGNSVVTPFLPIRDALVQEAFGITELQPETSFDIALGVTSQLNSNFSVTLDVYQITIDDRIIVSGGIPADDFSQFSGAGYDEINIFTNAVNTTTQGLDFVANYKKTFDENNRLNLTLGANFNKTEVDDFNVPEVFKGRESDIIDDRDIVFLTNGTPNRKIIFSASYQVGKFSALARFTNFGEVQDAREVNPDTDMPQVFASKTVTDFSITGHVNDQFSITLGANNLFDVYPDMLLSPNVRGEVIYSRRTNQFGTQGRFVNLSFNYNWK